MKSIALFVLSIITALFTLFGGAAYAADDAVKSFEAFIANAKAESDGRSWVYQNRTSQKWIRAVASVSELTYDVKKTDSLVTPIAGQLRLVVRTSHSAPRDTEAEAAAAPIPPSGAYTFVVDASLGYTWRDGVWQLAEGKRTMWGESPLVTTPTKVTAAVTPADLGNADPALAAWYRTSPASRFKITSAAAQR